MIQTGPTLSVIIPAFNESSRIYSTALAVRDFLEGKRISYELLIVNDGSTDDTLSHAERAAQECAEVIVLSLPINCGKGRAVREGMLKASGATVLFTDADLSTPLEETEKFLKLIDMGCDVVIGSRRASGAKIIMHQPCLREWLGRGYTWLANSITGVRVTDVTCGFKAFRLKAELEIFLRQRLAGWSFDAELLFLARKYGLRVAEVPVEWRNNPGSRVRLIRDVIQSFIGLILIRIYALLGCYD